MHLAASNDDRAFLEAFEAGRISPAEFGHRAHVRLAYVYLTEGAVDAAYVRMRAALHAFLERNAVDPSKYHDTLTRAWIQAVRHFMEHSEAADSADAFIARNPRLLDSRIMLSHYSAAVLFSDEARARFVAPDLSPIPGPETP